MKSWMFLLTLASSSCATTGGGLFPSDDSHLQSALMATRERSAFDLDCKEQIQAQALGPANRLGQQMTRFAIGVRGCEKKASYVVTCVSNWGNISCTPELESRGEGSAE